MYKMECDAGVPAVPGGGVGVPGEGVLHHRLLLHPAPPALQDQREQMLAGPASSSQRRKISCRKKCQKRIKQSQAFQTDRNNTICLL
jgi:hypothetical protein